MTNYTIVLPVGIDVLSWAATFQANFPDDAPPILLDPEGWREWGNLLLQSPTFANACAPQTDGFADWRSWAEALVGSLYA